MFNIQVDYWYWWVFACIFLILEALVPGVIFLWLALAAIVLGAILWFAPGISLPIQILLFSLVALASILLSTLLLRKRFRREKNEYEDHPAAQYIGRVMTLGEPIVDGRSKVRVDDSIWKILGPDCPAGTRVKVVGIEGILLKVEPLKEDTRIL